MTIAPYVPPSWLTSLPSGIWSGSQGLPVLPYLPGQTPTVIKAPMWSTEVIRTASGRERRTAYWPYPLWQFELSYEVIRHRPTTAELFAMWEFFNVGQGRFSPFLFVDPSDNQIRSSAPQTFAIGDGATKTFQLTRSINSFVEPVYDVFSPTVTIGGTSTTAFTLTANGVINFTAAPAASAALAWSGYFYFGCRFLQDDLGFEQVVQQLWSGKSIKYTSLRA